MEHIDQIRRTKECIDHIIRTTWGAYRSDDYKDYTWNIQIRLEELHREHIDQIRRNIQGTYRSD